MGIRTWLVDHLFADQLTARVQQAVKVMDDKYWQNVSTPGPRAKAWFEVRSQLEAVQDACESNPLAARLVGMTTDFVVGAWARVTGGAFVRAFWDHPLNRLDTRIYRWCDELSRAGELFLVLSRNPVDGMSYVREVPALQIDGIETDAEDSEHELGYHQLTGDVEGKWWPGRDSEADQVMLHYAVNKVVGATRGTSDLAQVVRWLDRYDVWLEDRVRINRYKGAYLWHVRIEGAMPGQLEAKRAQYSRVPNSGSIIVTDGSETWEAVQPQIGADQVQGDGKAIRLMIAAGVGVPLHFLAEGESATRATAREMGTATYRHFARRQRVFSAVVEDVIRVAAARAGAPEDAANVRVEFESVLAEDRQLAPPAAGRLGEQAGLPGQQTGR